MEAPPSDNLYIADLPPGFDEGSLQGIFNEYGTITQFKLLPNGPAGKTAAMVRFQSVDEAKWLVENLDGNIPQGLTDPVIVKYADTPQIKAAKYRAFAGGATGYGPAKGNSGYGKSAGKQMAPAVRAAPYSAPKGGKGKGTWVPAPAAGPSWQDKGGAWKGGGKAPQKGKAKGKGKCSIKALHNGLLEAQALPGCEGLDNDRNALYISGLPSDTQDVDLYRIFAPFGAIAPRGVRAMLHPDGSCQGFGFVNYVDTVSVSVAASTLNGTQMPDGNELVVKQKEPKKDKAGGGVAAAEEVYDLSMADGLTG
mmetsp:Transcript_5668/g.10144  ORF Transcript_5668/g.10144 Transcript_5668/m.10144 type:complete len:309 (+) Transcript_5668:114-1040(+)